MKDKFKEAYLRLAEADKTVRKQMAEATRAGHLTTYGDLPGWREYQQAEIAFTAAAYEYGFGITGVEIKWKG